jgi:histidinol-phosphate aminotransferase
MSIFKSHIDAMSAYKPPLEGRDPKRHLLLDFNERSVPVSEPIKRALIDYINDGRLQMYPSYGNVVERIAAYTQVEPEQLMITNGSDQGIDLIIRAACREGDEAIIPGPSFAMYKQVALVENLSIVEPQYTRENGFPTAEVLQAISAKTRLICIANPNNPSGTVASREDIVRIAQAAPAAVILVDECYFEYCGVTVADLVDQYSNLVITRTFSKTWGLPSLRFGYVISAAENILALLNVRGPYDINQLAIVAVQAALDNPEYTQNYVREVMEESKPLLENFLDQQKIDYWPSGANFIWTFPTNAQALDQALQNAGILVRPKADAEGRLGLRITLGTKEQMERTIAVLKAALTP